MDLHYFSGFSWISIDSYGSPWILKGSGTRMASCGILWRPGTLRRRIDPLYIKLWSSRGLDLETWRPGGMDAGCWQD
jgi:hypothetical protein